VNLANRLRGGVRSRSSVTLVVAAVVVVLVLAVTGWSRLAGTSRSQPKAPLTSGSPVVRRDTDSSFTLMQMNLCLSGLAGCYGKTDYPAVVGEAMARIREVAPDAVTLNEACRADAWWLARRMGYDLRFSTVIYHGEPLQCIRPLGRGSFGDAVLTKAPIVASESHAFAAQDGIEQRRWLCATTRLDQDVCTAHLSTRSTTTAASANDAQCAELAGFLSGRPTARVVVFAGDVNRRDSCAPNGFWALTDESADQQPGVQHVYGRGVSIGSPSAVVLAATHSDHDVLVVRAR
jgi:endonuclease/exonuclease/phosphatase family metal-dependent hydrolase